MAAFTYALPLGAQYLGHDSTRFSIWAPDLERMTLEIPGRDPIVMERDQDGVHSCTTLAPPGITYRFRVHDELVVPDPAARMQQEDVHGPSVVVDPAAYDWQHPQWRGRPWQEMVIYEIHVGCYGGFAAIEEHLPRLADLGITAIELMPVADFPGQHNWGYDGVLPYAPDRVYGTPEELKHLIDTAHDLGLCVYLDVVYNHFGPDGNYLHTYASSFFSKDESSPWGAAIDFHQPKVREFFTHNALYWLMEYRFDGLRFDAVHAISDQQWLDEMAARIRQTCEPDRHVHLMLENERNTVSHLEKDYDAQWNDDVHNVVHVLLTGENEGYYGNYQKDPTTQLARALAEGFVYQGEPAPSKGNRPRGTPSGHLSPDKFIFFLQNHDQIGNRAFGERLTELVTPDALHAAVVMQLLSPQIPLLFMGEERGLKTRFLFFTDFHGELADAVRNGRRAEFSAFSHFSDPEIQATIPDPNAAETFQRSAEHIQDQQAPTDSRDCETLYRRLLELRRIHIVPHLQNARSLGAKVQAEACVIASWQLAGNRILHMLVNLSDQEHSISTPFVTERSDQERSTELLFESQSSAGDIAIQGRVLPHTTIVFLENQL